MESQRHPLGWENLAKPPPPVGRLSHGESTKRMLFGVMSRRFGAYAHEGEEQEKGGKREKHGTSAQRGEEITGCLLKTGGC